jgi:hypothetical protein
MSRVMLPHTRSENWCRDEVARLTSLLPPRATTSPKCSTKAVPHCPLGGGWEGAQNFQKFACGAARRGPFEAASHKGHSFGLVALGRAIGLVAKSQNRWASGGLLWLRQQPPKRAGSAGEQRSRPGEEVGFRQAWSLLAQVLTPLLLLGLGELVRGATKHEPAPAAAASPRPRWGVGYRVGGGGWGVPRPRPR